MADLTFDLGPGTTATFNLPQDTLEAIAREVVKLIGANTGQTRTGWLTVPQAAEHLGWPKQRLYKLTAAGAIPHRKHGNRLLFDRAELDEWLERYAHGPSRRGFQSVSTTPLARMDRRVA